MGLTNDMLLKVKEEIDRDPDKVGYLGKTDQEIADLLSNSVFKQRTVIDAHPSPLHRILMGLAGSPNIITASEVSQAKITT